MPELLFLSLTVRINHSSPAATLISLLLSSILTPSQQTNDGSGAGPWVQLFSDSSSAAEETHSASDGLGFIFFEI
jgi:hypothetical protein